MEHSELPQHLHTGALGEDIAVKWLKNREFTVLERNYRKKWGELDVIARKGEKVHFVEVKTVSYGTKKDLEQNVRRGTYRPEENVHTDKLKRMARAIQTWILEREHNGPIQVDVLTVRVVPNEKTAVVDTIANITDL